MQGRRTCEDKWLLQGKSRLIAGLCFSHPSWNREVNVVDYLKAGGGSVGCWDSPCPTASGGNRENPLPSLALSEHAEFPHDSCIERCLGIAGGLALVLPGKPGRIREIA